MTRAERKRINETARRLRRLARGVRGIAQGPTRHGYVGPAGYAEADADGHGAWALWDRYDPHSGGGRPRLLRWGLTEDEAMLAAYGVDIDDDDDQHWAAERGGWRVMNDVDALRAALLAGPARLRELSAELDEKLRLHSATLAPHSREALIIASADFRAAALHVEGAQMRALVGGA